MPESIAKSIVQKLRNPTTGSIVAGFTAQTFLIVSGIFAARILGPEGRGQLALLVLIPVVLASYGSCGLPHAVTHFLAGGRLPIFQLNAIVRRSLMFQLPLTMLFHATIATYALTSGNGNLATSLLFSLVIVPALMVLNYGLAILQGQKLFSWFQFYRVAPTAVYAISVAGLYYANSTNLASVTIVWVLSHLVFGLLAFRFGLLSLKRKNTVNGATDAVSEKEVIAFGLKGMLGHISPLENLRLDQLAAAYLISPTALGFYVIAQAFTNLPMFLAHSVSMVAFPHASSTKKSSRGNFDIAGPVILVATTSFLIAVPMALLMPWLVELFFGDEFLDAISIARILLLAAIASAVKRIVVECMRGLGREDISTKSEISIYPVFLAIVLFTLPEHGVNGIAMAVTGGQIAALIVAVGLTRAAFQNR